MDDVSREQERSFWRVPTRDESPYFEDLWPTETRGDGRLRMNNVRTGAAQGKSSLVRKAPCRLCGFLNDLSSVDHSGGANDGLGAGGTVTTATASAPTSAPNLWGAGFTHTENYGTQAYRNRAGCALCLSKNSTLQRMDVSQVVTPWDRLRTYGF